jgi:prepilin-type processing-associated H-X9-DG protein
MSSRNERYSDETLFGFVMGALPDKEMEQIRAASQDDSQLALRIEGLRELIVPLRFEDGELEPQGDLVASTMAMLANEASNCDTPMDEPIAAPYGKRLSPFVECSTTTKLAWLDSFVALAAGVVVLCVVIPSIFVSRESARRIACAANLRDLGRAIRSFAYTSANRQMPAIEVGSPLSFAGVTTMRLRDAGLLDERAKVWCPSIDSIDVEQDIPTTLAYLAASESTRNSWRYSAGGTYSYNLGYVLDSEYVTPTLQTRNCYPIAGDSLILSNDDDDLYSIHGSGSANVLYSDGRVRLIRFNQIDSPSVDHPYRNRGGRQEAGMCEEDCCLGPSFQHPLRPISIIDR